MVFQLVLISMPLNDLERS